MCLRTESLNELLNRLSLSLFNELVHRRHDLLKNELEEIKEGDQKQVLHTKSLSQCAELTLNLPVKKLFNVQDNSAISKIPLTDYQMGESIN
jgi:hypothetical protein